MVWSRNLNNWAAMVVIKYYDVPVVLQNVVMKQTQKG
jgi:hypothetical protein